MYLVYSMPSVVSYLTFSFASSLSCYVAPFLDFLLLVITASTSQLHLRLEMDALWNCVSLGHSFFAESLIFLSLSFFESQWGSDCKRFCVHFMPRPLLCPWDWGGINSPQSNTVGYEKDTDVATSQVSRLNSKISTYHIL